MRSAGGRFDAHDRTTIALSVLCLTRGVLYGLLPAGPNPMFVLDQISTVIPLWVYGIIWSAAGLFGIADGFRHKQGRRAMLIQSCILGFWAMWYFISAGIAHAPQYLITGLFFLMVGWVMWNHPKQIALDGLDKRS